MKQQILFKDAHKMQTNCTVTLGYTRLSFLIVCPGESHFNLHLTKPEVDTDQKGLCLGRQNGILRYYRRSEFYVML